jgi:trehalose/maltose hydrolase-like predicted phosphorylase
MDARLENLTDQGFDLLIASGFESAGEEKLKSERVHINWPVGLPAVSSWESMKISEPDYERVLCGFKAGTTKIFFERPDASPNAILTVRIVGDAHGTQSVSQDPRVSLMSGIIENPDTPETAYVVALSDWGGDLPKVSSRGKTYNEGGQISHLYPTIDINGPEEDREFLVRTMGHLTRAVSRDLFPVAKNGFAPFGLNNSLYFGHTFWDMDVWVLPSMLFLQPDAVRQMNQYRLDRAAQAEKNAAEFFKKPNTGMMFPWESSVSGKETVRASSVKEHHISGSVLWGLNLSEKAGIASTTEVAKVANGVSRFVEARSVANPDGREIKDVMSPDENHIGDNDLFTNLLAQWAMNGRKWDGPAKFKLPKDGKSFLTYDDDKERSYKQASAVLSIFPLQYPEAEKQARTMMERFEGKVSKNGPAMSDAIHATIWARLGEKEKAYDAWKRAWEPFVKGPQMMFSEKRSSERTYFYTGAAGCLNTVLYGFAGFRFDEKPLKGASWKKQLKSGWWLSCKPCLPPKWTSLRISPMIIDGIKYSVEIEGATVRIEPLLEY